MLNFSGTLVERDSPIAFAAVLGDFCGRSIEGFGQDAPRLDSIQRFCGR
jgi:hypothetical protein